MADKLVTVLPSGGDYTSLAAAIAGEVAANADLTGAGMNGVLTIECGDGFADGLVTINGFTTDATHYLLVKAAAGDEAVMPYSTSRYRIEGTTTGGTFTINDNHVRVQGIQMQVTRTTGGTGARLLQMSGITGAGEVRLEKCLFTAVLTPGTATTSRGVWHNDNDYVLRISNCVFVGFDTTNSLGATAAGTSVFIYNCTFARCFRSVEGGSGTRYKNNLYYSDGIASAEGYIGGATHASSTNNAGDIAANSPGSNPRDSQTFTFVDEASDDFHLASGDVGAKGFGTPLSADTDYPITDDFDGDTRSVPWDIGADHGGGGGGGSPIIVSPGAGVLLVAGFAPTVSVTSHQLITTGVGALLATGFAPIASASDHKTALAGVGVLLLAGFAPLVAVTDHKTASTNVGSLLLAGFAPLVSVTQNVFAAPGAGSLLLAGFVPLVLVTDHKTVSSLTGLLIATGFAPSVDTGGNKVALTGVGNLLATGFVPLVSASDHKVVMPGVGSLLLAGFPPTINVGVTAATLTGSLLLAGFTPVINVTQNIIASPLTGNLILTGFTPSIQLSNNQIITTATGALLLTGFVPSVLVSEHRVIFPGTGSLILTGFSPTVTVAGLAYDRIGSLTLFPTKRGNAIWLAPTRKGDVQI